MIETSIAGRLFTAGAPDVAAKDPWRTDTEESLATAKEQGRALLLDFTGSDWCVWCHRLWSELFEKEALLDNARGNLVLVRLDFPRRTKHAAELQARNDALNERFDVSGYPTVILLDASGTELGQLGYMEGGAKTYVRALKKIESDAKARERSDAP